MNRPRPTGREVTFGDEEIIVSKTDPRGIITYANEVFIRVSGYREEEVLGKPHSVIRHPDMPRCVFQLLWTQLKSGREIFAYVKNMARNGDHYWVLAHVTPTFDDAGRVMNFHSNRRRPDAKAVERIELMYAELKRVEVKGGPAEGMAAAGRLLESKLAAAGVSYDQFVWTL